MSIEIQIAKFEGPLALLLYLIRKDEMDIMDINVNDITSQYLAYIRRMKTLDLETAGDFIAMAATLIQIKSQMLLPQYAEEGEDVELEDPRKALVQKLLEYEQFQKRSKEMYALPLLNRDVWARGGRERLPEDDTEGEIIIEEGGLYPLIAHYRRAIRNMKKGVHHVARRSRSIAGRILEIKDRLVVGQRIVMKTLLTDVEEWRDELLITFLSALELGKMGLVSVFQAEAYGDIYLTAKQEIDGSVIGRVEEYDDQPADGLVEDLFDEDDGAADDEPLALELAAQAVAKQEIEAQEETASDDDIEQAEKELDLV